MQVRALILALGLAACAIPPASDIRPLENVDYVLATAADDPSQAFTISFQSISNRDLCFRNQDWPFPDGNWIGEGLFRIVSGAVSIGAPPENYGSCVGPSCFARLKAHTTRTAKLNYSVFGEPGAITRLKDKRLEYGFAPSFC